MSLYKARVAALQQQLDKEIIDLKELRRCCFNGIPDCNGYRALCWKLMLGYLDTNRSTWPAQLRNKRRLYAQFIDEMIIPPGSVKPRMHSNGGRNQCDELSDNSDDDSNDKRSGVNSRTTTTTIDVDSALLPADHPLSDGPDSAWSTYFKDNEVLLQIDRDVRRLCPDISFFQQATDFPCAQITGAGGEERRLHDRVTPSVLNSANVERKGLGQMKINLITKRAPQNYAAMEHGAEAHWEVVERILFLYAKLNPGQGYVQGMNELIGPIYYVFATDADAAQREHAEADCFFCFTALMAECRDFFIKTLDESAGGIQQKMAALAGELRRRDEPVWQRLRDQELYPQYYSFRWLTLMLSQEFPLPDVVRIWDSVFADERRFEFLTHVCCAMIMLLREQILENDFASNVKLLQNYPEIDINTVLSKAASL